MLLLQFIARMLGLGLLLASAGLGDLLDDLAEPPPARPRTTYSTVSFESVPPEVEQWRDRRDREEYRMRACRCGAHAQQIDRRRVEP